MATKSCCESECKQRQRSKTHRQQDKLRKLPFLSLSLASCFALGQLVSSLPMRMMRVSGLWGQTDILKRHSNRSHRDSTRLGPGVRSGPVHNIKPWLFLCCTGQQGGSKNTTKRGQRSSWGLMGLRGGRVGPTGSFNIMQLTGQQSLSAATSGQRDAFTGGLGSTVWYNNSHTNIPAGSCWFGLERHCQAPASPPWRLANLKFGTFRENPPPAKAFRVQKAQRFTYTMFLLFVY